MKARRLEVRLVLTVEGAHAAATHIEARCPNVVAVEAEEEGFGLPVGSLCIETAGAGCGTAAAKPEAPKPEARSPKPETPSLKPIPPSLKPPAAAKSKPQPQPLPLLAAGD